MPDTDGTSIIRCVSSAGVKRDGTMLDGNFYSDATWCRFQRGLPRKMGGYQVNEPYLNGICRQLYAQSSNGFSYLNSGHAGGIDAWTVNSNNLGSLALPRTLTATSDPAFAADPRTTWQFDTQYDNTSNSTLLFAHAAHGLLDPTNQDSFPVYYGNVYDASAMTAITTASSNMTPGGISGGICSLAPFMTVYGNDGFWAYSQPGYPTNFASSQAQSGATRITGQKILKGIPLRAGGGYSPAGLYWSIDSLTRAMFTGGVSTPAWQFDQLTTQISLLSHSSVILHDGTYYWAGVDRFLQYNGVVSEIPNSLNLNWFYDGINQSCAGKSFVMKVPRYGEIWWCYPRGSATECSHAVIYNYREKTWYDTPLPNTGRSAGLHGDRLSGNSMAGIVPNGSGQYPVWLHESGTDEINGGNTAAVLSSFTTASISSMDAQPATEANVNLEGIEPDFIQTGTVQVQAYTQQNVRAPLVLADQNSFIDTPTSDPATQVVPLRASGRIVYLKFTSNVAGGNYQMGQTMLHLGNTDSGDSVT